MEMLLQPDLDPRDFPSLPFSAVPMILQAISLHY
jgi:hypothetical protein